MDSTEDAKTVSWQTYLTGLGSTFHEWSSEKYDATVAQVAWAAGLAYVAAQRSAFGLLVVSLIGFFVVLILLVCASAALISTVALRHHVLSGAPGSDVIPLQFNSLPFLTEMWRWSTLDSIDAPAVAMDLASLQDSSFRESVRSYVKRDPGTLRHPDTPYDTWKRQMDSVSGVYDNENGDEDTYGREDDGEYTCPFLGSDQRHVERGGGGGGGGSRTALTLFASQLAVLKAGVVDQHMRNLLATSTLMIPTSLSQGTWLPTGEANYEALFAKPKPMFSSRATYSASMQLVFLKERIPRDAVIVLQTSMLMADHADLGLGQSLSSLDVLFRRSASVSLRTGDDPETFPGNVIRMWYRLFFYIPIVFFEYLSPHLSYEGAFPAVDATREISVTIPIYDKFTPPAAIQARLRALNFSLHQYALHSDAVAGVSTSRAIRQQSRLFLRRMVLSTSVQLVGLAYLLDEYPASSSIAAFIWFFFLYSSVSLTCSFGVLLCISYRVYRWWVARRGDAEDPLHPFDRSRDASYAFERSMKNMRANANRNTSEYDGDDEEELDLYKSNLTRGAGTGIVSSEDENRQRRRSAYGSPVMQRSARTFRTDGGSTSRSMDARRTVSSNSFGEGLRSSLAMQSSNEFGTDGRAFYPSVSHVGGHSADDWYSADTVNHDDGTRDSGPDWRNGDPLAWTVGGRGPMRGRGRDTATYRTQTPLGDHLKPPPSTRGSSPATQKSEGDASEASTPLRKKED